MVKRLYPQTIARKEEAAALMVMQGESEHAVEARQAIGPPLAPRRDDEIGISTGAQTMAAILNFGPQLSQIRDFAILGNPEEFIVARPR